MGRIANRLLQRIHRYQSDRPAWAARARCRFTPSCSHFAQEALLTRTWPVALLLIVTRLIRCNPLARRMSQDSPQRRRGLRPNSVRTLFAVLLIAGFVSMIAAGVSWAQSLTGSGCKADINGVSPTAMTAKDPLIVEEGEVVQVNGTVPPAVAQLPADQITSNTIISVAIIEGIFDLDSESRPGTGPNWGGPVNVDQYLKFGQGLYHVTADANGTPDWNCSAGGYIRLVAGNPLTKPAGIVATALFAVGAVGSGLASRTSEKPTSEDVVPAESRPDPFAEAEYTCGCISAIGVAMFGINIFEELDLLFGMSVAAAKPKKRTWVRAHPIAGFFSGLLLGLGITLLLQQFGRWPLTPFTVIVFPLLVAVMVAIRAWFGRPYKWVLPSGAPVAPPMPPVAPPAPPTPAESSPRPPAATESASPPPAKPKPKSTRRKAKPKAK